ncbi:MAG: hypothetical protein HY437_01905 [Candidatus Magasanikbacteria bacterium]|nr:hypothetical protein [Candidatus Magasanikbacteria bacterium]
MNPLAWIRLAAQANRLSRLPGLSSPEGAALPMSRFAGGASLTVIQQNTYVGGQATRKEVESCADMMHDAAVALRNSIF